MARSFNFRLKCRLFISSFRFCRPKQQHPLNFPETYHYNKQFPANPKSWEICYPNPPSTPVGFFAGELSPKSISVCCRCKLKSYARENGLLHVQENRAETEHKISGGENRRSTMFSSITIKKTKKKKKMKKSKKMANGYEGEEDEATEALMNSSKSFSGEASPVKRRKEKKKKKKGNEGSETATFVEVKRSKKPQEDFKRSMVQMILEKEIFEAKGLEQLLECYLTLNSPEYHRVIVGAFSDVWAFLFCDSQLNK